LRAKPQVKVSLIIKLKNKVFSKLFKVNDHYQMLSKHYLVAHISILILIIIYNRFYRDPGTKLSELRRTVLNLTSTYYHYLCKSKYIFEYCAAKQVLLFVRKRQHLRSSDNASIKMNCPTLDNKRTHHCVEIKLFVVT
jgi:hypothetical protein